MAEVVNLRRARKSKARGEREKSAAANRVQHGAPKHVRELAKTLEAKARHEIEARKLDRDERR